MEDNREVIEDLMRRYGYEEKEVEAAHHRRQARDLFAEIYEIRSGSLPGFATGIFQRISVDPHFNTLFDLLGRRVLQRDYPDGWGPPPGSENQQPS